MIFPVSTLHSQLHYPSNIHSKILPQFVQPRKKMFLYEFCKKETTADAIFEMDLSAHKKRENPVNSFSIYVRKRNKQIGTYEYIQTNTFGTWTYGHLH